MGQIPQHSEHGTPEFGFDPVSYGRDVKTFVLQRPRC